MNHPFYKRATIAFCSVWMFLMLAAGHAFAADLPDFIGLVEKNAPAIVNVQAVTSSKFPSSSQFPGSGDQQDVPEIFRRFFGPIPPGQQPRPPRHPGAACRRPKW